MNQNLQTLAQDSIESSTSNSPSLLLGGALVFLNLSVMLFVGLYWMSPVMHEFISGRPLL
tara:strand:+ start:556 stop:735 length:180 start_codon:yes stop_codon:yes gene_type:complete